MALDAAPSAETVNSPAPATVPADTPAEAGPRLHLTLHGLRSSQGHVRVCLWSNGDGFPDCRKNSGVTRLAAPAAETVTVDVTDLPPGNYGISVIHDENDNRRLDKGFMGLPSEGVGFSNNASAPFGPPKYAKVRFALTGETEQVIRMKYYL
nr:DUF2141 domain-containing protein [Pacificimonas pallii]